MLRHTLPVARCERRFTCTPKRVSLVRYWLRKSQGGPDHEILVAIALLGTGVDERLCTFTQTVETEVLDTAVSGAFQIRIKCVKRISPDKAIHEQNGYANYLTTSTTS